MIPFNDKLLYCYKFMSHCLPIYAFYTLLFIERGMSISEIAILVSLWSGFSILFEIPSGILPIDGAVEICWLLLHLLKVFVFYLVFFSIIQFVCCWFFLLGHWKRFCFWHRGKSNL